MSATALPIDSHRKELLAVLEISNALVLTASTGAGKSTRVPRWLLDSKTGSQGRIAVLQPRRLAATCLALRVAEELGEEVGGRVGYQVRFEGRKGALTRVLFQTYGVFVRQLLAEPLLPGTSAVLLDEFHERSLEMDLVLAWTKRLIQGPRPDLKLLVLSATLDAESMRRYLGGCAATDVDVPLHPVEVRHLPATASEPLEAHVARALRQAWEGGAGAGGSALIFLPGMREIRRAMEACGPLCRRLGRPAYPLHGSLDIGEQRQALQGPSRGPCAVFTTNVAETSLTIPGITLVIDSGFARVAAYDPAGERNTLHLQRIGRHNADQRKGRAGRTAPGVCIRLWSHQRGRDLPAAAAPEVERLDLTGLRLKVHGLSAGADPRPPASLDWLTPPEPQRWRRAGERLRAVGALEPAGPTGAALTDLGRGLLHVPAHPLAAAALLSAKSPRERGVCAAMIALWEAGASEPSGRDRRRGEAAQGDLFAIAEERAGRLGRGGGNLKAGRVYRQLLAADYVPSGRAGGGGGAEAVVRAGGRYPLAEPEQDLRRAVTGAWLKTFAHRIGARAASRGAYELQDGRRGHAMGPWAPGEEPPALLALEVREHAQPGQGRKLEIPLYLPVQPEWIRAEFPAECRWEVREAGDVAGSARSEECLVFRGLVLERRAAGGPPRSGSRARDRMVQSLLESHPALLDEQPEAHQLVHRVALVRGAMPELGLPSMDGEDWELVYGELCAGKPSLREVKKSSLVRALESYIGPAAADYIRRAAPTRRRLASGRQGRITYFAGAPPELSARIGDLIGTKGPFTLVDGRVAGLYRVLAPNGRTVQKTADLDGFWKRTYPEVKKELKRRYPRHPWP